MKCAGCAVAGVAGCCEEAAQRTLRVLAIVSLLLNAEQSFSAGAGVCPHFQQPPYTCITPPSAMSLSRIARSPLCSAAGDTSPSCRRIASSRPPLLLHPPSPSLPGRARRAVLPSPPLPVVSTATMGHDQGGGEARCRASGSPAVSTHGGGGMDCCFALPMSRPSTTANSTHTAMRVDLELTSFRPSLPTRCGAYFASLLPLPSPPLPPPPRRGAYSGLPAVHSAGGDPSPRARHAAKDGVPAASLPG